MSSPAASNTRRVGAAPAPPPVARLASRMHWLCLPWPGELVPPQLRTVLHPNPRPAVLETLAAYESQGLLTFTAVPVDGEGRVSAADVEAAITPQTCLVTLMHRQGRSGTLAAGDVRVGQCDCQSAPGSCRTHNAGCLEGCRARAPRERSLHASPTKIPAQIPKRPNAATTRWAASSRWQRLQRRHSSGACWCTAMRRRWAGAVGGAAGGSEHGCGVLGREHAGMRAGRSAVEQ